MPASLKSVLPAMKGLMQDRPLLISSLLCHAERNHPQVELVSETLEASTARISYGNWAARTRRLAAALRRLGVRVGTRVATMAWNTHRHLELFFAVSGIGAVCHTINPRLFEEQIRYIINHAEDELLFLDQSFLALAARLAPDLPSVRTLVLMTGEEYMPRDAEVELLCYEELLENETAIAEWPRFDENLASSLCYTSGTTALPKGVLFSHRSTFLHTFAICMPDNHGLSVRDCTMPVAPMFHANAWGVPYAACATGAKLVLPGRAIDGPNLHRLITTEQVTHSVGVPTVWRSYLDYIESEKLNTGTLQRLLIGGTPLPRDLLQRFARFGVTVRQGWGMTESSALGTSCVLRPELDRLTESRRERVLCKQGLPLCGIELRTADDDGRELPRDGDSTGRLQARGPWIAARYFQNDDVSAWTTDGWFDTGDLASIDELGYIAITDRAKDIIKSGGEWISSTQLESLACEHPAVAEAAVIAIPHPRWDERPLLIVRVKHGHTVSGEDLIESMRGRVASWWLPDAVQFVDEMPYSSTGKVSKKMLRDLFADFASTERVRHE